MAVKSEPSLSPQTVESRVDVYRMRLIVCRVSMGFRSKTVKIYENNTYNHGRNLQWVNLDDFKHTDEHTDTAIS